MEVIKGTISHKLFNEYSVPRLIWDLDIAGTYRDPRLLLGIMDCPFVAAIIYEEKFQCVGSIVTKKFILTSGSCVDKTDPTKTLLVRVGGAKPDLAGSVHHVEKVHVHPEFKRGKFPPNNIALIELKTGINSTVAKTVELVNREDKPEGVTGHLIGWSSRYNPPLKSSEWVFHRSEGPVLKNSECRQKLKGPGFDESEMCAVMKRLKKCSTTSFGAPLVNFENRQFGVYGAHDAECPETPVQYASVAHHRRWIDRVIHGSDYTVLFYVAGALLAVLVVLFALRKKIAKILFSKKRSGARAGQEAS